ncbi:MAG: hypothetical protein ACREQW_20620 [Candidatus Binatia bacterium]
MAKRVCARPDGLEAGAVLDIYSVSGCLSEAFADYINCWKHNGYWLFDSPAVIEDLARSHAIDLAGTKFFYYELYEREFHENKKEWQLVHPESSFVTNVAVPKEKYLEGYDVVTFSCGNAPECSPLSCNSIARSLAVNQHCLLDSFEQARQYLEDGRFNDSEPGPYRIFAVYSLVKSISDG